MRQLPIFRGYSVDFRLREFRKVEYGKMPEFVPFASQKGEKLMKAFLETPEGKAEASLQT